MSRKHSWIWEHIIECDKGVKCKKCDKTYENIRSSRSIKVHLFRHGIYNVEDNLKWINDTHDEIWQYFSKQNGYAAQCNNCQTLIQYAFDRCNLTHHLERKHKDIVKTKREEIARARLLTHFKLTDSVAACNYCNDRINIFQGRDALRSHVDRNHNINKDEENSGSHDNIHKKSLGNQEGQQSLMSQQSVDTENYAVPSFDYNNTSRQYLGNQEGQQNQMLQQSVYTENYAGTSFDYNNASRQYLGNQESQHSLMLQQSVDTESYAVPSFDYNNASRQYLGNQEGQQSLMLQQSVNTENYAVPSFDYNNASRQYLGNQGGQLSLMLQQSVDTESYAVPSFDYNNASRQYLGNQEGQQSLMLQQSVNTKNYTSPSFDYKNASRQYLENHEGQQSLMLQQSLDTENYTGPNFDYNNASRQYLGNQEGQQRSVDNYNQLGQSPYDQMLEDLSHCRPIMTIILTKDLLFIS